MGAASLCPGCGATVETAGGRVPAACPGCGSILAQRASATTVIAPSRGGAPGPSPAVDGLTGREVGGCRLERKLGQGGMGAVYRAHHRALDIPVAVKILPPEFARAHPEAVERFANEARAAAKLQHPNIVGVLNVGEDAGLHFIVMQLVEGESLQKLLDREGRLPVGKALGIARQIADALRVAAEHRIVHRDIKPDNILIGRDGVARLADLGLAKTLGADTALTASGAALGTPHYMAPEQAEDAKTADHRSDLYSLGCILYRMLCGRVPYEGSSLFAILRKHVEAPVPDPRAANPALPTALAAIIARLMAKSPDRRFQTAAELQTALSKVGEAAPPPPPRRSRAPVIAAAALTLLLVPAVYVFVHERAGPPAKSAEEPARLPKEREKPFTGTPEEKVELLLAALTKLNGAAIVAHTFRSSGNDITSLDLSDQPELRRLDPLKGLPLRELDISSTGVSDLAPLEGMPIESLNLSYGHVADLGPLASLPLTELFCVNIGLTDLGPLQGLKLERLECDENRIESLEPLKGMPLLVLHCANCRITDLWPLGGAQLEELHIAGNRISDLGPLHGMPLVLLGCEDNPIVDLRPLEAMELKTIIFTPRNVKEGMSILREMKSLREIDTRPSDDGVFQSAADFWDAYDAGDYEEEGR
ncbi:MAG: protein kinase [Planctomycetes bacterium]|nr:protein kinase [Planctomycetota bacterium]